MKFSKSFVTSFVSVDFSKPNDGPFTISINSDKKKLFAGYMFLMFFTVEIFLYPCQFSQCRQIDFSVGGNWYFNFSQELMHAVHELNLFSMPFLIPDYQVILLSASIFFEPACLNAVHPLTVFSALLNDNLVTGK